MLHSIRLSILLTLSLVLAVVLSQVAHGCIATEGRSIFIGKVHYEVHPGPPNYESIAQGDRADFVIFMIFDKPVCFGPDSINPAFVITSRVQLGGLGSEKLKGMQGMQYYKIEGEPYHSHTGHHRAPILVDIHKAEKYDIHQYDFD